MSAPTPNAALAYRVLDHIDANPLEWDQRVWQCGSAACFAGWAVRLSGGTLTSERGIPEVTEGPEDIVGLPVDEAAYAVLGMDADIAGDFGNEDDDWLFDEDNTRDDLGRLVAEIFGPRPAVTA